MGLVDLSGGDYRLGHLVVTALEKAAREAWCALLGAWVRDTQLVKRFGNAGSCPDIDRDPGFLVDVFDQLLFFVAQLFNEALGLVTIKAYALVGHAYQHRQQLTLQLEYALHLFLPHQHLQVMPELQRQSRILLAVSAHIHRWQLPQLFLRVYAKVCCSLLQGLLGLHFLEHVKAQRVQRIAESILIYQPGSNHRVDNVAVHLKT